MSKTQDEPVVMSPLAYQKIITANDFKSWEVGFYGITDDDDITRIHDVFMPEQKCHNGRTEFDEKSVSQYVAGYLKNDFSMRQLLSVWIHTHPGNGVPVPSQDDWDTFNRMMNHCGNVGMMMISTKNHMKAWIKAKPIKGLKIKLECTRPVEIDWTMNTLAKFNYDRWKARHERLVTELHVPAKVITIPAHISVNNHHIGNTLTGAHKKCLSCFTWKQDVTTRNCREIDCRLWAKDICWDCYTKQNYKCVLCWDEDSKAISRLTDIPVDDVTVDDQLSFEQIERPTDCDAVCIDCPALECDNRTDEYDASNDCEGNCEVCSEPNCEGRDTVPHHIDCKGLCDTCSELMNCEYVLLDKVKDYDEKTD
jgi:hypothetical protein